MRRNISEETIENLSENAFLTIQTLLRTDPTLQIEDADIQAQPFIVVCRDGVYDIISGRISPLNRYNYHFTYIDVSVGDLADESGYEFERFAYSMSGGDMNIRQLLLEAIGVIISGYMPKSFFVLFGPKSSGKSQFMRLLSILVGADCTMAINDLNDFSTNRFLTSSLVGKKLCLCSDMPNRVLSETTVAIIKQLTGGDRMQGERKYRESFDFDNEAALVVGTNHGISQSGYDEAFNNRKIIIPFLRTIPQEEQIPNIAEIIYRESAGYIVYHACEALRDLIIRKWQFTEVDLSGLHSNGLSANSSFIDKFVSDKCAFEPNTKTSTQDLYAEFSNHCGGTPPMNIAMFARDLSNRFALESYRTSTQRGFKGIIIREHTAEDMDNHSA